MEEDFALINGINADWETHPKNTLLKTDMPGGETRFWFAWESGNLRLILAAIVGRRKGIREEIYLIDNSRAVYHDRLRLADVNTGGDGVMLALSEMRYKVRSRGLDPYEVASAYMKHKLEDLLVRPEWYLKHKLRGSGRSSKSVSALQGGAPGLGLRH
jgi:hypothetical protein